jgi:hypothetical protein
MEAVGRASAAPYGYYYRVPPGTRMIVAEMRKHPG